MGTIIVSTNVTLDGISQDPTGDEGFAFGGWFEEMSPADREAWAKIEFEEAMSTDAMLFGARSYEWFASRWVGREGDWGQRLQNLPKYVVRSRPGRDDWGPTHDIDGDVVAQISTLKDSIDGTIVVYASYQLVQTLVEHDLVDEVRLFVFPHLVGQEDVCSASSALASPFEWSVQTESAMVSST